MVGASARPRSWSASAATSSTAPAGRRPQNVISSWRNLDSARSRMISFAAQVKANDVALNGVRQEALVGSRTTLDVLNAEQELLNSQVSLISARHDVQVNYYGVLSGIGRLTARTLGLPVEYYDEEKYYNEVGSRWIGWGRRPASRRRRHRRHRRAGAGAVNERRQEREQRPFDGRHPGLDPQDHLGRRGARPGERRRAPAAGGRQRRETRPPSATTCCCSPTWSRSRRRRCPGARTDAAAAAHRSGQCRRNAAADRAAARPTPRHQPRGPRGGSREATYRYPGRGRRRRRRGFGVRPSQPGRAGQRAAAGRARSRARPSAARQDLEDIVKEMLRPMLKEWLDRNLPPMVERYVEREIVRLTRR